MWIFLPAKLEVVGALFQFQNRQLETLWSKTLQHQYIFLNRTSNFDIVDCSIFDLLLAYYQLVPKLVLIYYLQS